MIKGTVIDKSTGEILPFVNVFISTVEGRPTDENRGTAADAGGVFALNASPGEYLTASYVGYNRETVKIYDASQKVNFQLVTSNDLPAVEIEAKQSYFSFGLVLLLAYLNSKI